MPSESRLGWRPAPTSMSGCRCADSDAGPGKMVPLDRSWAMRLLSIGCVFWMLVNAPATGADRTLSVTIYADDLALVQDRRDIEIKGGRQRIEFQDVSARIRPETASLT